MDAFLSIIVTIGFIWFVVKAIINSNRDNYSYSQNTHPQRTSERTERMDDYASLLKTKEWERKRDEIIERNNHECQWCHSKGTPKNPLQVHHKYYIIKHGHFIRPWDYPDKALITLCRRCHEFAHSKRKPPIYYRK